MTRLEEINRVITRLNISTIQPKIEIPKIKNPQNRKSQNTKSQFKEQTLETQNRKSKASMALAVRTPVVGQDFDEEEGKSWGLIEMLQNLVIDSTSSFNVLRSLTVEGFGERISVCPRNVKDKLNEVLESGNLEDQTYESQVDEILKNPQTPIF